MKSKYIKRIALTTLAVLMVGSSSFAGTGFQDLGSIKESAAILSLAERGIVHGTSVSTFNPTKPLIASEGVHLIVNAFDLNIDHIRFIKEPKATDYFMYADDDAWYAHGFIVAPLNGVPLPADLNPNAKWTKEQFLYYLVTTLETKNELPMIKITPVTIKDQADLNPEYDGLLQRAIHYGIISLDSDGNLNPKHELTRAEAAQILYDTLAFVETLK